MKRNTKLKPYTIKRCKFFTREERDALMKTAEARAIVDRAKGRVTWQVRWMLIHLAMHSGLRVSEIAALQIRDVHLKNGSNYIYVRQGKRGKDRDVAIDAALASHLKEFIKDKELWGQPYEPDTYLFSGNKGSGITPTALTVSFSLAVKEAGLRPDAVPGERLSIHSARHSYAVLLYKRTGNNLRYVQRQLGHSDINMTSLYADIDPEDNDRLANMILND